MPLGFSLISICGFGVMALGAPLVSLYFGVVIFCVLGTFVFWKQIPDCRIENNSTNLKEFYSNSKRAKDWTGLIFPHCFALAFDMFCCAFFNGVNLWVLNGDKVSLFGPKNTKYLVPRPWFLAITNVFTLLGDSLSRKLVYWLPTPHFPFYWLGFSVLGAAAVLSLRPIAVPLGMFLIYFANGAV